MSFSPSRLFGPASPLRRRNVAAGLLFLVLGLVVCLQSAGLAQGSADRMGPGYLPLRLGLILTVLGVFITLKGLREPGESVPGFVLGPIFAASLALVLFGLSIEHAGLVPASALLILGARIIDWRGRLFELTLLVLALAGIAVVVFHYGLGIPVPLWPDWS